MDTAVQSSSHSTPPHTITQTHIVGLQVRVVLLNAVIQDGHHYALACVSLFPGLAHIQVPLVCVVLPREALALGDAPSHSHCDECVPKTHPAFLWVVTRNPRDLGTGLDTTS